MLNKQPSWRVLNSHKPQIEKIGLRALFEGDPERVSRYQINAPKGISLNFSRHLVNDQTIAALINLAQDCELENWRDRMFAGDKINHTENRAVLHTALRAPSSSVIEVDGENVVPFVHDVLSKMERFSDDVRSGAVKGYTDKKFETIVNIGIGGSDLGPCMVYEALKPAKKSGPEVHYVSNVDAVHLREVLKHINHETTLFIIASKTFTTQETMMNARSARQWFLEQGAEEDAISAHFVALSTNEKAVSDFGIDAENMFPFRDWVGGRYSLWSSIGLSVCLGYGFETFRALLDGAHDMDEHFRKTPLAKNMPVIMALLGIWYRNFWGMGSCAVLPYAQSLVMFPRWLQQLDMESNGKRVNRDGVAVPYDTGPVIFGEPGTNGQHAFYQLIHQGTDTIPCDFIAAKESFYDDDDHHPVLLANMAAQAQALAFGRTLDEADGNSQREFPGNCPSSVLLIDRLDAYHLGMLLALYEHKVFVQGILWGINSFDQWGVELGKVLTGDILKYKDQGEQSGIDFDPATAKLIQDIL